MKGRIRMVGFLSVVLLVCVIIGQGIWLTKMREIRNNGYHEMVSYTLLKAIDEYLGAEFINPVYNFACGLSVDSNTFIWGKNRIIEISSFREYEKMMRQVF